MVDESKKAAEALSKAPSSNEELLAKIEKASERLEKANKEYEKNRLRAEELKAEQVLQGVAEVGVPPPKEETPAEYAEKVMAGKQ